MRVVAVVVVGVQHAAVRCTAVLGKVLCNLDLAEDGEGEREVGFEDLEKRRRGLRGFVDLYASHFDPFFFFFFTLRYSVYPVT